MTFFVARKWWSVGLLAVLFTLAGCSFTHSVTTGEGTRTDSLAWSFMSDQPSVSVSGEGREARAGGQTPPDAATVLMRPVVMAGIGLLVIGGLLSIARMKFPVVPLGASLGVAGLGLGMIVLGAFVAAISPFAVWIIIGAIAVAGITFGPGLVANMKKPPDLQDPQLQPPEEN